MVHSAITVSGAVALGLCALLRWQLQGQVGGGSAARLEVVGYVVVLAALAAAVLLERTIEGPGEGGKLDEWWAGAGPKVVAVWVLSDGAATAGAVFYLLTGSLGVLGLGCLGVPVLFVARPASLEERG